MTDPGRREAGAEQERLRDIVFEMLGLVRGVLADGVVNDAEALAVADWIAAHPEAARLWPADALSRRIGRIFEDGVVDEDEREELMALFEGLIAEHEAGPHDGGGEALPFDAPPPVLQFNDRVYVFVGRFAYGSLGECHRTVVRAGGNVEASISERTDYLVIGAFGRHGWSEPPWRAKVDEALARRVRTGRPAIVDESHWAAGLP